MTTLSGSLLPTGTRRTGTALPWATIAALIIGLWVGTGLGARLANLVSPDKLRVALVIVIAAIAAFMAFKAWA